MLLTVEQFGDVTFSSKMNAHQSKNYGSIKSWMNLHMPIFILEA